MLLPIIWLLVICVLVASIREPYGYVLVALASFATVLPPIAYFSAQRLLKKAFRSIPGGAYVYQIDEQGVSWHSPIGGSQVNWHGFTRVHKFKSFWVLIIAERQFVALPTDQLDESTRALILAKVKSIK